MILFSVLVRRFLAWSSKCRHATTRNVYRHYYARFLAEVGDIRADRLTPAKVSAWARTWHQSQAIARLYRWACDDAFLLSRNPIARLKHPPKGQRKRILTAHEMAVMLRSCRRDLRALLLGYRESMARPGELRAAQVKDVYPKTTRPKLYEALRTGNACIVLWDYKNRTSRKETNAPRVILVSPRLGRMIARRMQSGLSDNSPLFVTTAGRRWTPNALRCRMRRLRRRLAWGPDDRGESIVPYTFRHTGATDASAAGIRDRILADILGHVETKTTARYQHLHTYHLQEALRALWHRRQSQRAFTDTNQRQR